MICAVIKGPSFEKARQQLLQAEQECDLAEWRLDLWDFTDLELLKELRSATHLPIILTFRPPSQGGSFQGTEEERLGLIQTFASLSPQYLDLEYTVAPPFVTRLKKEYPLTKIIISFHDFEKMPHLPSVLAEMQRLPGDLYKIAVTTQTSLEALELLSFMKAHPGVLAMGMGSSGAITRILSPLFGGPFIYASLSDDLATAPGQISAKELSRVYDHRSLTSTMSLYGLIGDPIVKSVSHISHNCVMRQLNLASVYVKFPVPLQDLSDFLQTSKQVGIRGLSVTMPLKEKIIPYLDFVDPWAKKVGAVNTLVFDEGAVKGYNTDGEGALNAIENRMKVAGKRVVLIGAGGACRAIAQAAMDRGAKVCIYNRTEERAKEVAGDIGCEGRGLEQMGQAFAHGYEIIINTTPHSMPFDPEWIFPGSLAMDIALQPRLTEFLSKADEKGCPLVYGYEMFINQAVGQFKLWFGDSLDLLMVKKILQESVEKSIA